MCDAFSNIANIAADDEKVYQFLIDWIGKMEVDLPSKICCRGKRSGNNKVGCTMNENHQIEQIHDLAVS